MQDEGWGEVFEVARSKGDVRENLLQVLDSDSMHLEVSSSDNTRCNVSVQQISENPTHNINFA